MGLFHGKRTYVEQIQLYELDGHGKVMKDKDDKPILDPAVTYTVVAYRDSGSLRQPPFVVFLSSLTLLLISCASLHRRDKQVMKTMALKPART